MAFYLLVTLKCWYLWEFNHMGFMCFEEGIPNKSCINSPLLDWIALRINHEADFDLQCPLWGCLVPGNFCWVSHAFVQDLSLWDSIFHLFFFLIFTKSAWGTFFAFYDQLVPQLWLSLVWRNPFSFIWLVWREGFSCRVELQNSHSSKSLLQLWCRLRRDLNQDLKLNLTAALERVQIWSSTDQSQKITACL